MEMFTEADRELRALPDTDPWVKKKKAFQVAIRQQLEDWVNMQIIANELRLLYPQEEDWWIADAYATRRSKSVENARTILLDGLALHYESATIRYNLACYACVMGHPGERIDFLKEAVRREQKFEQMALEDEDLVEVREALQSLGWGSNMA